MCWPLLGRWGSATVASWLWRCPAPACPRPGSVASASGPSTLSCGPRSTAAASPTLVLWSLVAPRPGRAAHASRPCRPSRRSSLSNAPSRASITGCHFLGSGRSLTSVFFASGVYRSARNTFDCGAGVMIDDFPFLDCSPSAHAGNVEVCSYIATRFALAGHPGRFGSLMCR
jgi:hypothetical protein